MASCPKTPEMVSDLTFHSTLKSDEFPIGRYSAPRHHQQAQTRKLYIYSLTVFFFFF